ncbi:TetR/AcrR family transcriptional regulator [Christensenellaceae bacterium OttesenSCG-928-K19]|nr:TetR/AcrR family transcriptional regulator [Christensenellaceae bacterium OttesenSCG-928-K19]
MPKVIENVSQRIIEAALQIYHEDGFERISMRRIAKLSGLAVGTVYNRFEDKEALLAHVLAGDIEQIRMSMMENVFGKPAEEALYAAIHTFISKTMEESHDIIRCVLDMRSQQEYVERILVGACEQIRALLQEIIIRVYEEHSIMLREPQAAMLSDMALSMMQVAARHGQEDADLRATVVYGMVLANARDTDLWAEQTTERKKRGLLKSKKPVITGRAHQLFPTGNIE